MTTGWDEDKEEGQEEAEDPGFIGGGGVAETAEGEDESLDEHGDNLTRVDDEEG